MSQTVVDDLEEGEIADDDIPEPIIVEKRKSLPRRYTLNNKKISKHKKSCKHSIQHNRPKDEKVSKIHKKHRKECPKHYVSSNYQKSPVVKFKELREDCRIVGLIKSDPKLEYNTSFMTKSAFKNFRSPPRKILKENSHKVSPRSNETDSFPKLLSEYKNTQNELNKHKNNNLKDDKKHLSNISNRKIDTSVSEELSLKNKPVDISSKLQSDDEDEEELRRQALASCIKRPTVAPQNSTENDACKENCLLESGVVESDNYEVVDMDVDNENENVEIVNDLFVIDTTPSYLCERTEIPPPICSLNSNFGISDSNADFQINGFLPNLNAPPNANFTPEIFNNLYSNVEAVEDPHFKSSQLDDEFEEELLRAELIANMNSARLRNKNVFNKQSTFQESTPVCVEAELSNNENVFEEKRIVSIKNENSKLNNTFNDRVVSIKNETIRPHNAFNDRIVCIESETDQPISSFSDRIIIENENSIPVCNFSDRAISIESENIKESIFKEERTVSIVSTFPENKNVIKSRSVFAVSPKPDFLNAANSPVRNSADIKVKLNVNSNKNSCVSSSVILPQERIVISLNNDSSSDDSDQEDCIKKGPDTKSVVASLEALITNARHESDEKVDSTKSSNNTSDVVSCLSKAQQEEYNSLRKILAKKQPFYPQASPPPKKAVPENSELVLLKKKLLIAKRNLEKEKTLMNNTMKEVAKKKRSYLASKFKTQLLKEQLLAAEKIRKSDLQLWTKCTSEFQTLKKSVTKREAIIGILQKKINALFSDFGRNGLPSLPNHTSDHDYNLSL